MCIALRKTKDDFSKRKRGLCSCGLGASHLGLADKLVKERPVMNHCLAQVFGAGVAAGVAESDFMPGAIAFDNKWMIHGDVRGTLFKIADRIATSGHDVAEELIGRARKLAPQTINNKLN